MYKLAVDTDAERATLLEQALLALEEPALLAVSRFENGEVLWRVEAYSQETDDRPRMVAILAGHRLTEAAAWEDIPATNWVRHVEAMLSPVAAGVLLVHGPHDRDKAAGHAYAIEIEAGEEFVRPVAGRYIVRSGDEQAIA